MPAKGDGITKRKDGRYVARYTIHTSSGPKRKVIYGKKYKEVERKLAEARGDAVRGIVFDAKGVTVGAFLERWLEDVVRPNKTNRTYAAHANKPKVSQGETEIEPLDAEQAGTFLQAASGDRYEALYVLCLMAGLRQGEALGLKWTDIDLDAGTLRVSRQLQRVRRDPEGESGASGTLVFSEPKNASRRTIGLPQRAVTALRSHRKRQAEEKLQAGPLYEDNGLVFATAKGTPLEAQNVVNRHFKPLLQRAGLPAIRFHDLRHSCLSLLAQRGEPIRDLQALAGHATAAFTLQRYTHHYDASAKRTATAMGDILPEDS